MCMLICYFGGMFDLCLVCSSSTFLPTLKSHRLLFFLTINFKLPLDAFKIELFLSTTFKNSLDIESLYEHKNLIERVIDKINPRLEYYKCHRQDLSSIGILQ
jgi:hypothetical protein